MNILYETARHISDERKFCRDIINEHWPAHDAQKLATRYGLDYAIVRNGTIAAFVELKCRKVLSSKYDTLILNINKLNSARLLTTNHVKCWLFVRWLDCDGMLEFGGHFKDYHLMMVERQDRDDAQDISPCFEIPISDFTLYRRNGAVQSPASPLLVQ